MNQSNTYLVFLSVSIMVSAESKQDAIRIACLPESVDYYELQEVTLVEELSHD